MKPFTPQQRQAFEGLRRQFPELGEFLTAWRQDELEKFPYVIGENMDVLRGRVQALTEIKQGLFGRNETP